VRSTNFSGNEILGGNQWENDQFAVSRGAARS